MADASSGADRAAFVARFAGVYERSPWVAEQAWEQAEGITDPSRLAQIFRECVEQADDEVKLELIRSHPDLAGRAAIRGELTAASTAEQAGAGIDQCTRDEFDRFQTLNRRYREKFGFPFVMAVRGRNRHEILAAFEERLENDKDAERAKAIGEIHKIASLRLHSMRLADDN